MLFQFVQILYWVSLATWFGGVLFVAMAAPVIFRTIRDSNPILPDVLSVNLDGQHSTLLAGSVVASILGRLAVVELVCAGTLLLALIAQPFVIDLSRGIDALSSNRTAAILRACMYLAAAGVVLFEWWFVWPRIWKFRQEYIDHADEPDIANPAKERFDHEHRRSVTLMGVVLFLLLGMILFSGNITPRGAGGSTTIAAPSNAR